MYDSEGDATDIKCTGEGTWNFYHEHIFLYW